MIGATADLLIRCKQNESFICFELFYLLLKYSIWKHSHGNISFLHNFSFLVSVKFIWFAFSTTKKRKKRPIISQGRIFRAFSSWWTCVCLQNLHNFLISMWGHFWVYKNIHEKLLNLWKLFSNFPLFVVCVYFSSNLNEFN